MSTATRPAADDAVARDIVGVAVTSRRLFPRGGRPGLEPNEMQVLLALYVEREAPASALADGLLLARTTVSHALRELQERGLVEERENEADRRWRSQRLTRSGRQLAKTQLAAMADALYPNR